MNMTEARTIIGSMGFPSKMPGTCYGLPATACRTGSKLVKVPGSVCNGCYALTGTYKRTNVAIAQRRRLASITNPRWADAMVFLLQRLHRHPIQVDLGSLGVRLQRATGDRRARYRYNAPGFHRWHDSGDLQSVDHLRSICEVAARTPWIKHWLPTQELAMVKLFVGAGGVIPKNLVIRVSSVMLGDHTPRNWPTTSSVAGFGAVMPRGAKVCPAAHQDHHCGKCRDCWSSKARHVIYPQH